MASKKLAKAKIEAYLLKNKVNLYPEIIQEYPLLLEASFSYWRYLMRFKQYAEALQLAEQSYIKSDDIRVPTSEWVEARILYAKSLLHSK